MLKYLLINLLIAVIAIHADDDCCDPQDNDVDAADAKRRLDKASFALSGEFLYQLTQSNPDKNVVASATSILQPLAQISLVSKDVILQQLLKVLYLNSQDEVEAIYPDITASYANLTDVEFQLASKYYANVNYPLTESFKSDSVQYFNSSSENIDFSNSQKAAKEMNDWVSKITRGKIQDLISSGSLSEATIMVLLNAIYFNGNWVHQFNPNNTQKRDFTKRNKKVIQLDTMYQETRFNYTKDSNLKIQALEMPYKGGSFSFLCVLPEAGNFDATVKALRNPDTLIGIIDNLHTEKVKVYLPKMKINTKMDVGSMLQKYGVTEMFKRNNDGFDGLVNGDNSRVYVSSAVQKAFIDVNEVGTEAAAATGIIVGVTSVAYPPPKVIIFNANRSFLVYLLYNRVPLFCAAFVGGAQ